MSLLNIPLLNGIETAMKYYDQNQKVIAGNVANADTPGAKAEKLKALDFSAILGSAGHASGTGKLAMAATNAAHMPNIRMAAVPGGYAIDKVKTTYEVNPDKNNIILEEQLLAAQRNASQFNLAANMYRKSMGMMKMAMGIR